jgi:hypothetical protein
MVVTIIIYSTTQKLENKQVADNWVLDLSLYFSPAYFKEEKIFYLIQDGFLCPRWRLKFKRASLAFSNVFVLTSSSLFDKCSWLQKYSH